MSIKLRLRLSYIAMLVVPILLIIITIWVLSTLYAWEIGSAYHLNLNLKSDPFKGYTRHVEKVTGQIQEKLSQNFGEEEEKKFLKDLDEKTRGSNIGIIVRKGSGILYASAFLDKPDIIRSLSKFGTYTEEKPSHFMVDNQLLLTQQTDFYFYNKVHGSIFIVADITALKVISKKYLSFLGIAVLLILIFTNGILTQLVSRGIVRPLESLKKGAKQISEGNLDFQVKTDRRDEIGEVCVAFEEMRMQLKESIELQQQYENNRKELISNISHDLKTPITAVKGYVEGIMDGVADTPEKMDRYIGTIYTKAVTLDQLIDELFLFSKLDLKKLPFHFEKIDIIAYMKDSIEELQFDLEEKGIKLELDAPYTSLMISADRDRIRRVIINIVENAVKYMNCEEGHILVRLRGVGDFVRIEIKDNGKGIMEKDLPFIFDRFYRADLSRSTATGGSGLGLAIAKRIVEEHGGSIWAESEEGKGASIFFTLRKYEDDKEGLV